MSTSAQRRRLVGDRGAATLNRAGYKDPGETIAIAVADAGIRVHAGACAIVEARSALTARRY